MYKYLTSVNELRDLLGPEIFLPHDVLFASSITSKNAKMRFTRISSWRKLDGPNRWETEGMEWVNFDKITL